MDPKLLRRPLSLWPLALALGGLALVAGMARTRSAEPSPLADGGFEEPGEAGFPLGWSPANWGPEDSGTDIWWTGELAREGRRSLRLESLDDRARPGVTATLTVEPGLYELHFHARARDGATGQVRGAVGGRWSAPTVVGQEWTPVVARGEALDPGLEVAVQSCGPRGVVWVDSVSLVAAAPQKWTFERDLRPSADRPRLLYLSGNPHYFADTAAEWVTRGFAGFSCAQLMPDWKDDVDDNLLAEVREALCRSEAAGLAANALLIGLHAPLPDPLDDEGCLRLVRGLTQAARLCTEAGFSLLLLDTEYAAAQFDPQWPGHDMSRRVAAGLAMQVREQWTQVGRAIATEAPELDVALTPEGVLYYGPLWGELLAGLLEGLKAGGTRGRVHVFCQGTYWFTDPTQIAEHAATVRSALARCLGREAAEQWRVRGAIALGAWPLGYYRPLRDAAGAVTGWSGRQESFGDRPVGAFSDKSANYSPQQFRAQLAALRGYSDSYCFVYGHGSSWWQVSDEQAKTYSSRLYPFAAENYALPTVSNITQFHEVAAEAETIRTAPAEAGRASAPGAP